MSKHIVVYIIFSCLLIACKPQTPEEKIQQTSAKVLAAIKNGDEQAFKKLIGMELAKIGKDELLVHSDFKRCKSFYDRYVKQDARIIVTTEYDILGSRKVIILFYDRSGSLNEHAAVRLELFFGPPDFVPLSKMVKYNLVREETASPGIVVPPRP